MPGSEQGASRPLFTRSELLRLIIPLVIEQLPAHDGGHGRHGDGDHLR